MGHTKQSCRHYKHWISKQTRKDDGASSKDSGVNDTSRNEAEKIKVVAESTKTEDEYVEYDFLF